MRVRSALVLVSSVFLTLALLCIIPASLLLLSSGPSEANLTKLDPLWGRVQIGHYFVVANLIIVFLGVIVIWTGYAKRSRSAWVGIFAVTWFWVFPFFALQALTSLPEWILDVISVQIRSGAQWAMIFSLMQAALLLPFKSVFVVRDTTPQIDGRLHKIIRHSAVTLLFLVLLALFVETHLQVYDIPFEQLNAWRVPDNDIIY